MTDQKLANHSTSISRPAVPIDRGLSDAVASILNTAERVEGQTVFSRLPSPQLKRQVEVRLADVRRSLAPVDRSVAERERAARAIAAVLSGWVTAKVADPASKVAAYLAILGDLPCWVIEQICRDVARGNVDGISPDFPPSAARLHQLGDEVIARLRKEAADLEAVKNAKLSPEAVNDDETRKRIAGKFKSLTDAIANANSSKPAAKDEPFKHDEAAFKAAQQRVRAEYALMGKEPPSGLALSPTALKELRERDAFMHEMMQGHSEEAAE